MFRKALVPLDGTNLAESIVPRVLRLLEAEGSEIVLLRAVPYVGLPRLDQDLFLSRMEEDAAEYLRGIEDRLDEMGVPSKSIVLRGDPAEAILAAAGEEGADLIAMSTHGRTGVGKWFFGSVAEKVRTHAAIPLLIIRAEEGPSPEWKEIQAAPYSRILLPLDGSALAEEAISHTREVAEASGAEVIVFRCVSIPPLPGMDAADLTEGALAEAREYLDRIVPKFEGRGVPIVRQGNPADNILSLADKSDVSLIVMTSHGRSGLSQFLMGSVAAHVVRGSGKPLLILRCREC